MQRKVRTLINYSLLEPDGDEYFEIVTSRGVYYFKAADKLTKMEWIQKISETIEELTKNTPTMIGLSIFRKSNFKIRTRKSRKN